jgi:hypothetical protein
LKREKAKYILFHALMILIVLLLVETASSLLLYFEVVEEFECSACSAV